MRLEEEAQGRGVRLFVKRQVKHGRGLVHVIPAGEIEDEQRSHEVAAVLPPHGSVAGGDEGSMCDAGDVRIVPGLMTALATRVHAEALPLQVPEGAGDAAPAFSSAHTISIAC